MGLNVNSKVFLMFFLLGVKKVFAIIATGYSEQRLSTRGDVLEKSVLVTLATLCGI